MHMKHDPDRAAYISSTEMSTLQAGVTHIFSNFYSSVRISIRMIISLCEINFKNTPRDVIGLFAPIMVRLEMC